MALTVIEQWSDEQRRDFRKAPVFGRHLLSSRKDTAPLFTDEALAALLDAHPIEDLDIATMANEENAPQSWVEVARAGRSGAEIVEAVHRGRLWVNVRNIHRHHGKMAEIVGGIFDDLQSHNAGFKPRKHYGGLLISSPHARVFYHADAGEMMLWQMRGEKRFYIYPNQPPFLDLAGYERLVLSEAREEIEWRPEFDDSAEMRVMKPGDFATWPLAAPHRVVNGDMLNVSITTEYTTRQTRLTLGAVYANGFMRRRMGLPLAPQNINASLAERGLKCALALPIQALGLNKPYAEQHFEMYELDPAQPDYLQALETPRLRTT